MERKVKILIILAIVVIIARLFTAFVLPDIAYTDSIYHLSITKEIAATGQLPFNSDAKELVFQSIGKLPLPPLFFHVLTANFFVISNNYFNFDLASFLPVFFSMLQLALLFLVFREFFKNKTLPVLLAFTFAAAQTVLAIFSSVNYPDSIAALFVLFSFYLLIKFDKTKNPAFLFLLPFAIAAFAVSKLTATILVPAFFIAIIFYTVRSKIKHAKKIAIAVVLITFLLSSFWFFADFQRSSVSHPEWSLFQKLFSSNVSEVKNLTQAGSMSFEASPLNSPFDFIWQFNESFWFFLPSATLGNLPGLGFLSVDLLRILFTVLTLPVLAVCFYGLFLLARKKENHYVLILLILLFSLIPFAERLQRIISMRMLLPVLPFFGILFARGMLGLFELKKPFIQKIFFVLFILTVVYSLGFMVSAAIHYQSSFAEVRPAYEFIKTLPEDSKLVAQRHIVRGIVFFGLHDANRDWDSYATMDAPELHTLLKGLKENSKVDYLLATCSKNPWNQDSLDELEEQGLISIVFETETSCARVYEIA